MENQRFAIRLAEYSDIEEIRRIYNHAITNTVATFDLEEKEFVEMSHWFKDHDEDHPILVLTSGRLVKGWASLSPLYKRAAYARSAEISIYLDPENKGKGYGKALMEALIERAQKNSFHTLVSRIAGGNQASFKLHERYNFTHQGTLKETGFKFGKFIDVEIFQLMIDS